MNLGQIVSKLIGFAYQAIKIETSQLTSVVALATSRAFGAFTASSGRSVMIVLAAAATVDGAEAMDFVFAEGERAKNKICSLCDGLLQGLY